MHQLRAGELCHEGLWCWQLGTAPKEEGVTLSFAAASLVSPVVGAPWRAPPPAPWAVRTPRDPRGPHGLLTASFPPTTVCNTSYCPAPADCPEGSRQLLAYEEGACCPRQNCSEFPAQRWQARS